MWLWENNLILCEQERLLINLNSKTIQRQLVDSFIWLSHFFQVVCFTCLLYFYCIFILRILCKFILQIVSITFFVQKPLRCFTLFPIAQYIIQENTNLICTSWQYLLSWYKHNTFHNDFTNFHFAYPWPLQPYPWPRTHTG